MRLGKLVSSEFEANISSSREVSTFSPIRPVLCILSIRLEDPVSDEFEAEVGLEVDAPSNAEISTFSLSRPVFCILSMRLEELVSAGFEAEAEAEAEDEAEGLTNSEASGAL